MANSTKRVDVRSQIDKKFESEYGYSKDITGADKPGFVTQDNSDLHNTVSLNDLDSQGEAAKAALYSNTFNVPSKNNSLGLKINPTSTLSKNGGLSSLYGSDPLSTYSDRNDLT
jgi:hypothetical protein